ncbi:MAG: hypothetical protein R3Y53_08505 [Bacillota bacterium]
MGNDQKKNRKKYERYGITSVIALLLIAIMPVGLLLIDDVRSDVYLESFEVTEEGRLILEIYTAAEKGYVRKVTTHRNEEGLYLDFHSTTGINNSNGAKTSYTFALSDSWDEIYIYRGKKSYEKVLEKVGSKWVEVVGA